MSEVSDTISAVLIWMNENPELQALLKDYLCVRRLPDDTIIGVQRLPDGAALFVGVDEEITQRCYRYPNVGWAIHAMLIWDGEGDPPGPWLRGN